MIRGGYLKIFLESHNVIGKQVLGSSVIGIGLKLRRP